MQFLMLGNHFPRLWTGTSCAILRQMTPTSPTVCLHSIWSASLWQNDILHPKWATEKYFSCFAILQQINWFESDTSVGVKRASEYCWMVCTCKTSACQIRNVWLMNYRNGFAPVLESLECSLGLVLDVIRFKTQWILVLNHTYSSFCTFGHVDLQNALS